MPLGFVKGPGEVKKEECASSEGGIILGYLSVRGGSFYGILGCVCAMVMGASVRGMCKVIGNYHVLA